MSAKTVSKRYRLSIPEKNISLNAWCKEQGNLSESLRYLITKAIEKEGIVDIMCLPVKQLPRRGRPPMNESREEVDSLQETVSQPINQPINQPTQPVSQPTQPVSQPTEPVPPREPTNTQNNSDLLRSMLQ